MEKMIYAIVWVKNDFTELESLLSQTKGILGEQLYPISLGEITAIAGDLKRGDLIADSTGALAFAAIIDTLVQKFTLLPMRFGSMMDSTGSVIRMLERNFQEILQNLHKVENKLEFGLKVICDSEKLKRSLSPESEDQTSQKIQPEAQISVSVFREYVNKKLETHRVEELMLKYIDSVIARITSELEALDADCKFRKMPTEKTIIDALFLLEKTKNPALIIIIEDLHTQYPELNFILTGPWPPYNFVESTIK